MTAPDGSSFFSSLTLWGEGALKDIMLLLLLPVSKENVPVTLQVPASV